MLSAPTPFPLYLLPSIPFRRRRSSTETTGTVSSDTSSVASPTTTTTNPPTYLSGHRSHLRCTRCLTDLCLTTQIISKGFTGRHGRAYLVAPPNPYNRNGSDAAGVSHRDNNLPNTYTHKPVPRQLVTGGHTVSDISCALCGAVLGWKYVAADEESQRYKVGKFILETKRVCRGVSWEDDGGGRGQADSASPPPSSLTNNSATDDAGDGGEDDEGVEFDSQDEDECEDLFAGVWSPALARKRRRGRAWREGRNGAGGVEEV